MTCDERLEILLNRAGQTISDLPKTKTGMPYPVERYESMLKQASDFLNFDAPAGFEIFTVLQYAFHLTDVIDRMETALENVIGERDYCIAQMQKHDPLICKSCIYFDDTAENAKICEQCKWPSEKFQFSGIPDDWSADDDKAVYGNS